MSNQAAKNIILGKTLHTLVEKHGLTLAEVAQIRLSHLFLAGKNPSINFTPEGSQESKVVTLDMETHRALVNWLVNRPDSVSDLLFPGQGTEAMSQAEIQEAIAQVEELPVQNEPSMPEMPKPAVMPEVDAPPPGSRTDSSSRPVGPFSRPETGGPPPGIEAAKAPFTPPPMAPEEGTMVGVPRSTSGPKPPPVPPARPVAPPPRPPEPLVAPVSPSKAVPVPKKEEPAQPPAPDQTMISAAKPEVKKEEETKADRPAAKPVEKEEKQVPPLPKKEPAKVGGPAMAAKKERPSTQPVVMERPLWARFFFPGVVVIALLLCGGCLAGAWFAAQSEPGSQLLAWLGWSGGATPEEGTAEATGEAVVFESALPTPTLPPTSTPTAAPATNTPPPTDTATPTPLPTDTPAVTDTPTPTETPIPTDTPAAEEEETEAPTDTPTPGLKYPAPTIIEPKNDFAFIRGNTIVLQWNPVDLAPDEQYAVRLVYPYQGQPSYQGTNVKEPQWTVPLDLFGKIDGPDNRYEWFVVIERANDDGSATAVSPESEHRTFTWK